MSELTNEGIGGLPISAAETLEGGFSGRGVAAGGKDDTPLGGDKSRRVHGGGKLKSSRDTAEIWLRGPK